VTSGLVIKDLRSAFAGPFALSVPHGSCVAVTGPSGSGKSLMLRMIADLDPNDGEVWLDDLARASVSAPEWRRRVIYLSAEAGWWNPRVGEHFEPTAADAAKALAGRLGLGEALFDAPVAQLSTGEKQRFALVRALLRDPAVLLLDEPTGPLDQESVARVEAVLAERLAAGTALILVTHDAAQATRLGTRHYIMGAGRLAVA
jgi:ABC-type iron transport system FetAB ATPase subunit